MTPEAEERVAVWRDRRLTVMQAALDELDEEEQARIAWALPALQRLVVLLGEWS